MRGSASARVDSFSGHGGMGGGTGSACVRARPEPGAQSSVLVPNFRLGPRFSLRVPDLS